MPDFNCNVDSIYSNEYYDFIIHYEGDLESVLKEYNPSCYQIIDNRYVIIYTKREGSLVDLFLTANIQQIPIVVGPYGKESLDDSGLLYFHNVLPPGISLRGKDVLVGIIDSGIDYTQKCFIYEDNTSKIVSIWDQTIVGNPPEGILYGSEYTNEDINMALASNNPYDIVPEKDLSGHGTFLAGIVAGRENEEHNYVGVAPDSELVVVKLKSAKQYLYNLYLVNEDAVAYQDTDIIMGIEYLLKVSNKLKKPISILIGLGSNAGAHDGTSLLEDFIIKACNTPETVVSVAGGNEGNKMHHFVDFLSSTKIDSDITINVAPDEKGFYLFIVGSSPDELVVSILSPTGELIQKIPLRTGIETGEEINFLLERTKIQLRYTFSQVRFGDEYILLRFEEPTPGVWTVRIFGDLIVDGRFDAWLPRMDFINEETVFISADPYTTITVPATTIVPITVGAYDHVSKGLYIASSRGYTREDVIKPDLVAPGVNVFGPLPNNTYGTMTGTSVAAAHVAGAVALLLEWGIVYQNDPNMNTLRAKVLLIRGARRKDGIEYPNREWGYGELDLYNTFEIFKGRV